MGAVMPPRFNLGKVTIKEEAALALALSGQDASFFLEKHASGDWGEGNPEQNETGIREGSMIWSKYRTLRGHEILAVTFPERQETYLFCPPNSVIKHEGLYWLGEWGPMPEPPQPIPEPPKPKPKGEEMAQQPGNGSSRFEISQLDMGGWVRVYAVGSSFPPDLPIFLSHTLTEWFRQRPQYCLRCVVPIQRDGNTVELHAWYDAHVFPPTPEAPHPLKG
jgi:hypothetical protein